VMAPSIGESSGIPKGKKLLRDVEGRLRPLFTGQVFFQSQGLPSRDSRKPTERASVRLRAGERRLPPAMLTIDCGNRIAAPAGREFNSAA
jgi:hypothetical protein